MDQLSTKTDYEFSGYRLDTVLQVLVSPGGQSIALPGRAYDVLRYLLERPGELVDKATLMRSVWPSTVVEDNNLNQCILVLRRALGESAGERRFILTVPGRGFKLVAPVRAIPVPGETPSPAAPPDVRRRQVRSGLTLAVGSALLVAVIIAGIIAFRSPPGATTRPTEYAALTDLSDSATAPALSPDGKMLAFVVGDPRFLGSGRIYLKSLPFGDP
ncbi:MAG: winged helix-turn-helix domain-containing protein, partial [Steroidobacteraceae bacterium]